MATLAGPEKESEHAARGTAAHTVAEDCLLNGGWPADHIGRVVKTKDHEIEFDEELAESAHAYVGYVRNLPADQLMFERNFSLAPLGLPMDAGGTCDTIALMKDARLLEVVDFKNGRGVVDASTPQLMVYALAALVNLPGSILNGVDRIASTIVQPRAYHKEGAIRTKTYTLADLVSWAGALIARVELAAQAKKEFEALDGNRVLFDEWAEKWLTPGSCTFCPAEGFCPKLREKALSIVPADVSKWFEDPDAGAIPDMSNSVKIGDPAELGHILDGLDTLEDWIRAVRSWAHHQAEQGQPPVGYQLAEKIGNRAWSLPEAELYEALHKTFKKDEIYVQKLRSPAQLEALAGEKRKGVLADYITRPVKGTNLVASAKTTREPAPSKTDRFFEKVN